MPKAYVYTAHGGAGVEAFHDLPIPVPGPGELLVRVCAAGVNPIDWKRRTGYLPGAPRRPCRRCSATRWPASSNAPAAATAHDGLRQLDLPAGARLLITGVGRGVGVAATQIARHFGITVIGTASPGEKGFVESLHTSLPDRASPTGSATPHPRWPTSSHATTESGNETMPTRSARPPNRSPRPGRPAGSTPLTAPQVGRARGVVCCRGVRPQAWHRRRRAIGTVGRIRTGCRHRGLDRWRWCRPRPALSRVCRPGVIQARDTRGV
jgi:hypothetical protein